MAPQQNTTSKYVLFQAMVATVVLNYGQNVSAIACIGIAARIPAAVLDAREDKENAQLAIDLVAWQTGRGPQPQVLQLIVFNG